jgi:hypothetical protein
MKRRWLVVPVVCVVIGLLAGCAGHPQREGYPPRPGYWPDVPCPPDNEMTTAYDRLTRIIRLAGNAERFEIVWRAIECRDFHGTGPNHQPPAEEMSERIFKAWQHARAATDAPDPGAAENEWLACKGELTHDP